MAEPIEIIIRKGSGGEGTGFGIPGAQLSEQATGRSTKFGTEGLPEKTDGDRALLAMKAFALATLKKQISYSISQYGNMTGNYIQQSEIELSMQIVNDVVGIGMATAAGAKFGIGGAVIGFDIATANTAINYSNQYRILQTNIVKLNTYANIMQERSGNTYNNDSRGTYN